MTHSDDQREALYHDQNLWDVDAWDVAGKGLITSRALVGTGARNRIIDAIWNAALSTRPALPAGDEDEALMLAVDKHTDGKINHLDLVEAAERWRHADRTALASRPSSPQATNRPQHQSVRPGEVLGTVRLAPQVADERGKLNPFDQLDEIRDRLIAEVNSGQLTAKAMFRTLMAEIAALESDGQEGQ